jgi:hypothetical protein
MLAVIIQVYHTTFLEEPRDIFLSAAWWHVLLLSNNKMDLRAVAKRNSSAVSLASRQSSADSAASATSTTSRRSRLLKLLPGRKRRTSAAEAASDEQTRPQNSAVDPQQLGLVSSNSDSNSLVLLDDGETERYVKQPSSAQPCGFTFGCPPLRHHEKIRVSGHMAERNARGPPAVAPQLPCLNSQCLRSSLVVLNESSRSRSGAMGHAFWSLSSRHEEQGRQGCAWY